MDKGLTIGVVSPFVAPIENLARAIEEDNKDRMLRALRQIQSVAEFYVSEIHWRSQNGSGA